MIKTLVSLTDRQSKVLSDKAKDSGISKSELIRRILDSYIESHPETSNKDKEKVECLEN